MNVPAKSNKPKENLDEVRFLLEHGADSNANLENGASALHLANAVCRPDIVMLLAKWGADLNARSLRGRTPLHVAARLDRWDGKVSLRTDTIDALLALPGIQPDLRDKNGCTPLHLAASFNQNASSEYPARKLVEDFDVDINSQDKSGKTVLYRSTELKNDRITRLLLSRSDTDSQRSPSLLPLFHTARESTKMVRILLEADSTDPNMKDASEITAIRQNKSKGAIKLLIESGAEVDIPDTRSGLTARQEVFLLTGIDLDQLMAHETHERKKETTALLGESFEVPIIAC